jgi:hypothetical protein
MGVKISNLPAIVTPALTDIFPVVQAGVTYKESGTQFSSLFATAGANANITSLTGLTGGIVGTATNNNAAAGYIGEFLSSVVLIGAAVPITTTTQTNITTLALTAGDWDVWGSLWTLPAAGTTTDTVAAAVSQTSATLPTTPAIGGANQQLRGLATAATQVVVIATGTTRISLAAPATIYLVGFISFAVSTMSAYGSLSARRAR